MGNRSSRIGSFTINKSGSSKSTTTGQFCSGCGKYKDFKNDSCYCTPGRTCYALYCTNHGDGFVSGSPYPYCPTCKQEEEEFKKEEDKTKEIKDDESYTKNHWQLATPHQQRYLVY